MIFSIVTVLFNNILWINIYISASNVFAMTGTGFVTRIKDNAVYDQIEQQEIKEHIHSGVREENII